MAATKPRGARGPAWIASMIDYRAVSPTIDRTAPGRAWVRPGLRGEDEEAPADMAMITIGTLTGNTEPQ